MRPTQPEIVRQYQRAKDRGLVALAREVGPRYDLAPSLLLGIASRESRMGEALAPDCTGDRGNAVGVFQIDRRYHPGFVERADKCDDRAGMVKAANLLAKNKRQFGGDLVPAVAAYNGGVSGVREALESEGSADAATTGGDYSADVLGRARAFQDLIGGGPNRAGFSSGPGALALLVAGVAAASFFSSNSLLL